MDTFLMTIKIFLMLVWVYSIQGRYNFLFIVVDDLRPTLGCYGDKNAFTPNIDRLSKDSVTFSRAYAQQALCAPSRNSFLTSRRPDTLHLYDFYSYWRDTVGNYSTLPQYLKDNGYLTLSVGKVFHPGISSNYSDDSPYSWSKTPYHPYTNRYSNAKVCSTRSQRRLARNLICPVDVSAMPFKTLPDIENLNKAQRFIRESAQANTTFFLAVGFQKPHIPLKYPQTYLKYHPLQKFEMPDPYQWPNICSVAYNPWTDLRERDDIKDLNLTFPWERIPASFGRTIIQSYYAAATYIDDMIGTLLDELEISNLRNNTVIILTSDHGWSLGEHAEWAKYSNFDVAVHVPLLISIPTLTHRTNKFNRYNTESQSELGIDKHLLQHKTEKKSNISSVTSNAVKSTVSANSLLYSKDNVVNLLLNRNLSFTLVNRTGWIFMRELLVKYRMQEFLNLYQEIEAEIYGSFEMSSSIKNLPKFFKRKNYKAIYTELIDLFNSLQIHAPTHNQNILTENVLHMSNEKHVLQVQKDKRSGNGDKTCAHTKALVELVDIFPTIAELADIPIPVCPEFKKKFVTKKNMPSLPNPCSEGISLVPLIRVSARCKTIPWKKAAFSQYPRPSVIPTLKPNSDKPRLNQIHVMGYSIKTNKYRYTAWVSFVYETKTPDWKEIIAEELYDHRVDIAENFNIARLSSMAKIKHKLQLLLKHGWRYVLPGYDKKETNTRL